MVFILHLTKKHLQTQKHYTPKAITFECYTRRKQDDDKCDNYDTNYRTIQCYYEAIAAQCDRLHDAYCVCLCVFRIWCRQLLMLFPSGLPLLFMFVCISVKELKGKSMRQKTTIMDMLSNQRNGYWLDQEIVLCFNSMCIYKQIACFIVCRIVGRSVGPLVQKRICRSLDAYECVCAFHSFRWLLHQQARRAPIDMLLSNIRCGIYNINSRTFHVCVRVCVYKWLCAIYDPPRMQIK